MKSLPLALFVALLMVGCGEEAQKEAVQEEAKDDPSVPLAIPCVACGEKVSKKTEECRQCGHPTPDSVVAYKEAKELERIRAEEERKRWMEEQRLAAIRAEEEAKRREEEQRLAAIRAEEERKRREEEERLAAIKAKELVKAKAKQIGLDDHTIILNAVYLDDLDDAANYTGWVKATYHNGKISSLGHLKDGKKDGLSADWYLNGQKKRVGNYKDGKKDGLWTLWYENGQKQLEENYKDGNEVGAWIEYDNDGKEMWRYTYKDGEPVED